MSTAPNPQTDRVRVGTRTCRYCRKPYFAVIGSPRLQGCPTCCPTIPQAIAETETRRAGD